MNTFEHRSIKWPYVTHLVDPRLATGLLPAIEETRPGALMLARVVELGRHRELESHGGRRMALYPGDVFACVLAHDASHGPNDAVARCSGGRGHLVGIGGLGGEVIRAAGGPHGPTVIEWLGRLAGHDREPLHLSSFRLPPSGPRRGGRATAILVLGAGTAAEATDVATGVVRSLAAEGHTVAAARLTGAASVEHPNALRDAGAAAVYDVTHAGFASTAGCSTEELLAIAAQLRRAMATHEPEFVVLEIGGGVSGREAAALLSHEVFRASIDAVLLHAADASARRGATRQLCEMGLPVLATARDSGEIERRHSNGRASVEPRCLDGSAIHAGALVEPLRALRAGPRPATTIASARPWPLPAAEPLVRPAARSISAA